MVVNSVTYDQTTGICTVGTNGLGNALLAAYDYSNKIIWSWHIWITDSDPTEQTRRVDPGNTANDNTAKKYFMDRNLGALATTTTQPLANDAYKYFGLLYQWGRKEPFTGQGPSTTANIPTSIYNATNSLLSETTPTANSLGGFTYNNGAAPTMLPCLQNPTTHYYGGNDGNVISGNPNTWIDRGNIKSIYDPCPYGYRVPIDGSWNNWTNPHTQKWTDGDIKGGLALQSTWWPAAGYRNSSSAAMYGVANDAYYWSSSPHTSVAYYSYNLNFYYHGGVNPRNSYNRSFGFALRCVQE